ncbi:MAG: hypothetical protein FWC89_05655, partial [Defluviitaleaceae bacterium]|nr:hypothetical protein [Defluviitaleaceae bacterium]
MIKNFVMAFATLVALMIVSACGRNVQEPSLLSESAEGLFAEFNAPWLERSNDVADSNAEEIEAPETSDIPFNSEAHDTVYEDAKASDFSESSESEEAEIEYVSEAPKAEATTNEDEFAIPQEEETSTEIDEDTMQTLQTLGEIGDIVNFWLFGEAGAFDISVNFELGRVDGTGQQIALNMDMISVGSELWLETDISDIMGGFLRGMGMTVAIHTTWCWQNDEITNMRFFLGGSELTQASINNLGLGDIHETLMLGGAYFTEWIHQQNTVLPMHFENFEINHSGNSVYVTSVASQTEMDSIQQVLQPILDTFDLGDAYFN